MLKFVIDREIAGVGNLGGAELHGIAVKSCPVLRELPQVQWLHSYVTDDKIYCVYTAPDAAAVRAHAKRGGFPANGVSRSATSSTRRPQSELAGAAARRAVGPPVGGAPNALEV